MGFSGNTFFGVYAIHLDALQGGLKYNIIPSKPIPNRKQKPDAGPIGSNRLCLWSKYIPLEVSVARIIKRGLETRPTAYRKLVELVILLMRHGIFI